MLKGSLTLLQPPSLYACELSDRKEWSKVTFGFLFADMASMANAPCLLSSTDDETCQSALPIVCQSTRAPEQSSWLLRFQYFYGSFAGYWDTKSTDNRCNGKAL